MKTSAALTIGLILVPSTVLGWDVMEAASYDTGDDRVLTGPSAETMPKGDWSFTDYELAMFQFSYGITDDLQFSMFFSAPVFQVFFAPSIKWRAVRTDAFRLAVMAAPEAWYWYVHEDLTIFGGQVGLIGDIRLDGRCTSFVSIGVNTSVEHLEGWDILGLGDASATVLSVRPQVGVVGTVSKHVKLLAEFTTPIILQLDGGQHHDTLFAINYGIRIYGGPFGGDIAFVRPFLAVENGDAKDVEGVMKYAPMGIPFLTFTYLW